MDAKRELVRTRLKLFLAKKKDSELNAALTSSIQQDLIERLVEGTTCAIVSSLRDLQKFKENELLEEREKKLTELRSQGIFDTNEAMKEFDLNVLKELDELITEQQNSLACAHVPLFYTTSDPKQIKIQMAIMEFIESLANLL
uniref:Uncharacterized protein n=1 Tax=Panagrellus redivivus TaxID=6233 RepID=A0A7E4UY09_PANRE